MNRIVPEVASGHLEAHSDESALLRPFLENFEVTWAKRREAFGSELSVYFLKPTKHMERAFGFESEILTIYSKYAELQPRTLQAIELFLSEAPARGRVDTMVAFLISEASDPVRWIRQYMASNPESRLVVGFSAKFLRRRDDHSWTVRSLLSEQLYQRDLFDYRLPINSDYFFFGREELIFDLHNAFKRSENRGLFGLRKTGKTSVFFKLARLIGSSGPHLFIYIDCKFPANRMCSWDVLLTRLADQLQDKAQLNADPDSGHASDVFLSTLRRIDGNRKIAIVFDEVEYISPASPLDAHWKDEFVPFWQTIWHAQSLLGNLAIFLGGVNPTIVEQDLIGGTQNPLFGIVPYQYLGGLNVDEVRRMLRTLGRPMGMRFSEEAVRYVTKQYGGHPLLTRIAASVAHRTLRESRKALPRVVELAWLQDTEGLREAELEFYCGHVTSELRRFYPDEYEIMAEIADGNLVEMFDFIAEPTWTTHLTNYGLLGKDAEGRPAFAIPVLRRFMQLDRARERGTQTIAATQPRSQRRRWLKKRKQQINDGLEELQRVAERVGEPSLFGPHSYPESHRFFELGIVSNEAEFATFVNTCNRCFVEAVERYGRSIGNNRYLWGRIQGAYPALGLALRRIKVYRHSRVHIRLEDQASEELQQFLSRDLGGRSPTGVAELWFQLQQCVLDDLLVGILVETDRLS